MSLSSLLKTAFLEGFAKQTHFTSPCQTVIATGG